MHGKRRTGTVAAGLFVFRRSSSHADAFLCGNLAYLGPSMRDAVTQSLTQTRADEVHVGRRKHSENRGHESNPFRKSYSPHPHVSEAQKYLATVLFFFFFLEEDSAAVIDEVLCV